MNSKILDYSDENQRFFYGWLDYFSVVFPLEFIGSFTVIYLIGLGHFFVRFPLEYYTRSRIQGI